MKKIILFFGLLLSAGVASAQSAGDVQINGGIGYSGPGFMVYGSADFGVADKITIWW